jgi:hypothetical protein
MRERGYSFEDLDEMTTSAAVPAVVRPFAMVKRARPATLSGTVGKLKKRRKRLLKRFSKQFSPDRIARI